MWRLRVQVDGCLLEVQHIAGKESFAYFAFAAIADRHDYPHYGNLISTEI